MPGPRILTIAGSQRAASTNATTLRTLTHLATGGIELRRTVEIDDLPHFNPDDDHDPLPSPVIDLRQSIADTDAIVFCTPEYAGSLPGSFKNLLDWTVGGTEICDKPVAWINISTSSTGARGAHQALEAVLRYTGADIVDDACLALPVPRTAIDDQGRIVDRALLDALRSWLSDFAGEVVRRTSPTGF